MQGEPPRRHYAHTEATRLMCAGVHLDAVFRTRVFEELVGNAQRPAAPSYGADVLPVLAHALHARREEVRTALQLLAVWAGFVACDLVMFWDAVDDASGGDVGAGDALSLFGTTDLPGTGGLFGLPIGWAASYAVVVLLLWFARAVSGRGTGAASPDGMRPDPLVRARGRLGFPVTAVAWIAAAAYWYAAATSVADTVFPVIFPLLAAAVVWRHQQRQKDVFCTALARQTFAETEPPELPARYRAIGENIRREQDSSLTLYDANRPFLGAGTPRKPWNVVMELKPADGREPDPLSARRAVDKIVPRIRALRASAVESGRDRLRELEIEEFVFLPSGVGRDEPLYSVHGEPPAGVFEDVQAERHLAGSVGEGGESRRHFLRVRVGAWNEQVVVSLLVRVHTQGGMLVLEVVPHVLGPVVPAFRAVDTIVGREPPGLLRDALRACGDSPAGCVALGVAALRTLASVGALRREPPELAAPDAPLVSLRELAGTEELSLFQEMDVARYIRTLQDRIGEGVRDALEECGYRTDRLEQHITNINNSGLYIQEMSGGAVATGSHGTATHQERTTA